MEQISSSASQTTILIHPFSTTLNQLGYKIYSRWFITSEPMPRASWGKHVLWMPSLEYLMNWWVTLWSLAEAGPNIVRACWQGPERPASVSAYRDSFWSSLADKWKSWFHPICRSDISFKSFICTAPQRAVSFDLPKEGIQIIIPRYGI